NRQPRSSVTAAAGLAAGGTTGATNSGNFGVSTAGAGMSFGAQAAAAPRHVPTTTAIRQRGRIIRSLHLGRVDAAQETPRHVGDDRHAAVARLVRQHASVAIEAQDAL